MERAILEYHFCVELFAPQGLRGIADTISLCDLPLCAWTSGYNGKVILHASEVDWLEWEMDSSDSDKMFASGLIAGSVEEAESKLRSLSECLVRAKVPHCILLDDVEGNLHTRLEHRWQSQLQS